MHEPTDHVDVRSASLMDADDVAALLSMLGYPCDREDASERIHAIIANERQALVLARQDGAVCGLIALDFMYYLPLGTHTCRITAMVITPEAQGRGLVVAPDRVARIRTRMPASAEFRKRNIFDAGIHQRRAQRLRIELRMLARAREFAHIHDLDGNRVGLHAPD